MKQVFLASMAMAGCATLSLLAGCGQNVVTEVTGKPSVISLDRGKSHDHGRSHGSHGHAHHGNHAHPSEGPHRGHLIELGHEDYHVELTHDNATQTVALYILDAAAKKSVPIEENELTINLLVGGKPSQFVLPAAPQRHDPQGTSSCFQLADRSLCDGCEADGAVGRINVTIRGKPYVGTIEHHAH